MDFVNVDLNVVGSPVAGLRDPAAELDTMSHESRTIVVDCAKVTSEAEFWRAYLDAVQPDGSEYFGRNLDAFWDALSAGGPGWPGECQLDFVHTESLARLRDGEFLRGLERIAAASKVVTLRVR